MSNDNENSRPSAGADNKKESGDGNSNPRTSGQKQGTGRNERNNGKTTGTTWINDRNRNRTVPDTKKYRGETVKMNGHVFQLHAKKNNKAQFPDTMEALRLYTSTA